MLVSSDAVRAFGLAEELLRHRDRSSSSSPKVSDRIGRMEELTGLMPLSPAVTDNRPAKFFDHRFLLR